MTPAEKASALDRLATHALAFKKELKQIDGQLPASTAVAGMSMASREFSLTITKIDEAMLWARAGIEKA